VRGLSSVRQTSNVSSRLEAPRLPMKEEGERGKERGSARQRAREGVRETIVVSWKLFEMIAAVCPPVYIFSFPF
jgi:hypothetical protein